MAPPEIQEIRITKPCTRATKGALQRGVRNSVASTRLKKNDILKMINSSVSPRASPHPKHPQNPTNLNPLKSPPLLDPQLKPPPSLRLKPPGATTTKAQSTLRCKSIITPSSNSRMPLHASSLLYSTKSNYKHNNHLQHKSTVAYANPSPLSDALDLSAIHAPVRILPRERKTGNRVNRLRRSKLGKM